MTAAPTKALTYPPRTTSPSTCAAHAVYMTTSSGRNARRGVECVSVTPTANTSTPSHGAQSPSWSPLPLSTRTGATPTASMPARIPKASRASCTAPVTSRLEPDTICPAASSTTAVVSVAPGRNTTSEATMARSGGSTRSWRTASAASAATMKAASTGSSTRRFGRLAASSRSAPTTSPKIAPTSDVARRGIEDEGQADCQDAVAEDPDQRREPGGRRADRPEPRQSVRRVDRAAGGIADEAVDGGELVEAERATEGGRELEHHGLPGAHRDHEVGRERADPGLVAPYARATAVRRSWTEDTGSPISLSAAPSWATNLSSVGSLPDDPLSSTSAIPTCP